MNQPPATESATDAIRRRWRPVLRVLRRLQARTGEASRRAARAAAQTLATLPGRARTAAAAARARLISERQARRGAASAASPPDGDPGTIVASRDDDLSSVIGLIDTADEINLVLVVPRAARHLRNPGVWPRVAAHVRRRGIALGVVSSRRDVRQHAQASGLRAAGSPRALRRRPPRRVRVGAREFDLPQLPVGAVLQGLLLAVLMGSAFVGACYVVPSAEIVIVPPTRSFARTVTVLVDPVADETNVALGVVPGVTVRRTIRTVLATEATGTTEVGGERATVELVVENRGGAPVGLKAGALVVNDSGVAFTIDEDAAISADEMALVSATAERAGTIGNVDAGELWAMGGVPATIRVTNPGPATGGTNVAVPAVASDDVDRLRTIALDVLSRVGARELAETVESGTVLADTVTVAIFSEEALSRPGDAATAFLMEYTAIISVIVVQDDDTRAFAESLLISVLPEGVALVPGTTTAELGGERETEGGQTQLELTATGLIADLFEPSVVRDELTGARPSAAAAALQRRLALEVEPKITVEPSWLPWIWLPRRGSRISIAFAGPPETTADEPVESAER